MTCSVSPMRAMLFALILAASPPAAVAQLIPEGGEFQVATSNAYGARVAVAANGTFVVSWIANSTRIEAQRFDRDGRRLGGRILVDRSARLYGGGASSGAIRTATSWWRGGAVSIGTTSTRVSASSSLRWRPTR